MACDGSDGVCFFSFLDGSLVVVGVWRSKDSIRDFGFVKFDRRMTWQSITEN